jgi:hypothetical protein
VSESHWGTRSLKDAVLAVVIAVAVVAGGFFLFRWSPWESPSEVDWLQAYETWSESIEGALGTNVEVARASCEATFDEQVGGPPTERLEPMARAARRGCATPSVEGWRRAQEDVVRALRDVHATVAPPRQIRAFSELARPIAGREAKVYCWSALGWAPFAEQYAMLRSDEEISLRSVPDTREGRIDLDPGACTALRGYVQRYRPPALSTENLELGQALIILAHEAEHLKSPTTSEVVLECYAVQHVRPFMRAAGFAPGYQTEIALQAWQLHYTQLPELYRTPDCRNDGPLDRNRSSDVWP